MNRAEIKLEARRLLVQTTVTASYFSDDDLNAFVNDGIRDMCIKAGLYTRSLTLTTTSGTTAYYLPWQFIRAKAILTPSGGTLDEAQVEAVGRIFILPSLPISYFIINTPIALAAKASGSYVTWPAAGNYTSTLVVPAAANGYMYECVTAGGASGTTPSYPTTLGETFVDMGITWKTCGLISSLKQLILTSTPNALGGVGNYTVYYAAIDSPLPSDAYSPNLPLDKHHYLVAYCCYRAAEKAKQSALATTFLTEYATGIGIPVPQIYGNLADMTTPVTPVVPGGVGSSRGFI